jgi:hypothetical protein
VTVAAVPARWDHDTHKVTPWAIVHNCYPYIANKSFLWRVSFVAVKRPNIQERIAEPKLHASDVLRFIDLELEDHIVRGEGHFKSLGNFRIRPGTKIVAELIGMYL